MKKRKTPSGGITPNGEYICPRCKKTWKNAQALAMHFRRSHTRRGWDSTKNPSKRKAEPIQVARTQEPPRVFSYFCPFCGLPASILLNHGECSHCRMDLGPTLMALNLTLKQ